MDWLHVAKSSFAFRRVKWPSWEETEEFWQITGGSIELSAFSELKAVGRLSFAGPEVPEDGDMVRIYCTATDMAGESATLPLATMFFVVSEPAFRPASASGEMTCSSTLQALSDSGPGRPYTVPAGTRAVAEAARIARALGLRVSADEGDAYRTTADRTFEADDSWLAVANWLLGAAGCSACTPDAFGAVRMAPYVEPTERAAAMEFATDGDSIMRPSFAIKTDYASTPNVVRLYRESEDETLWAEARNVDPASRPSVPSRRREKQHVETVAELEGATREERLASLEEKARSTLLDKTSDVEHASWECQWVPIEPGDAVSVKGAAPDEWRGTVTGMSIDIKASIPCKVEARRFVRGLVEIEVEGGSL